MNTGASFTKYSFNWLKCFILLF